MKLLHTAALALSILPLSLLAQQTVSEHLQQGTDIKLSATETQALLNPNQALFKSSNTVELKLLPERKSKLGTHSTYQQYVNGIAVYGAFLNVNKNAKGQLISSYSSLVDVDDYQLQPQPLNGATVWVVDGTALVQVNIKKSGHVFQLTYANGDVAYEKDMRLFFTDTVVKAQVFNPDPLTTAGVTYGTNGTYKNFNDSDYALLNNQRKWVSFPAQYNNGTFYLQNQYARIEDFASPYIAPVTSTTDTFSYTRKQDGFKQVMAMYHISALQTYLQSIGLNGLVPYQLRVDAQSGTADNSSFNYDPDTTLNFGTGGVPDAEDADVIVHEYTHAIVHSLNTGDIIATERRALEEGMCDVMACAYSYRLNPFRWKNIFSWDGNNEYWGGRNGAATKDYTQKVGDYYSDSEIWSSCLNNITERIGADACIQLMVAIMPQLTPYTTMPQAAHMIYDADSVLNNGMNRWVLAEEFNRKKFDTFPTGLTDYVINNTFFTVTNTIAFAQGNGDAVLQSNNNQLVKVELFDITGKLISTQEANQIISLTPTGLATGMYVAKVTQGTQTGVVKLVRN
jgi:hypothetical protein